MVLRLEVEGARRSHLANFLVGVFVGAVRHVVHRQVGQPRQQVVALGDRFRLAPAHSFDHRFRRRDVSHQLRRQRLVLGRLGLADLFRFGVARGFSVLLLGDRFAHVGVEREDRVGYRLAVDEVHAARATRPGLLEMARVVANGADVVHVGSLCRGQRLAWFAQGWEGRSASRLAENAGPAAGTTSLRPAWRPRFRQQLRARLLSPRLPRACACRGR